MQHWYYRLWDYGEGVWSVVDSGATEIFAMAVDISPWDFPGYEGRSVSTIGKLRRQGVGWGEIGVGAVVGIVTIPVHWVEAMWDGRQRRGC